MAYNFNSPSPYAAPRRTPRWPWVFAGILVLAIASATGLLLAGGLMPNGEEETDNQQLALVTPTSSVTLAPTQTPVPTPTAVDLQYPQELATEWATLWENGDFEGMYGLISAGSRDTVSQSQFVQRYQDIQRVAGISKVKVTLNGDVSADGIVPITVASESSLVGTITEDNEIAMIQEGSGWRVIWTPSMIFRDLGTNGCIDWQGETLTRGRILDREGRVLAEDKPVTRVSVVPANVTDPNGTYAQLASVLGMSEDQIMERVNSAPNASWPVSLKDMPADSLTDLLNAFSGYDGVRVTTATQRTYPYAAATVHVVGWVSLANYDDIEKDTTGTIADGQLVGRAGVEYGANSELAGKPGGELSIVDCTSRRNIAKLGTAEGQAPRDVYLTIDAEFQKKVDQAMTEAEVDDPESNDPNVKLAMRSAAVVLDPQTGAVLAMVSHPNFDPNGFITGEFSERDQRVINDPVLWAQLNRATDQGLPTGSIFKSITMAGALTTLDYTDQTLVDCPDHIMVGDQRFNDWVVENNVSAQGTLTLHQALVNSCNTVFYAIGRDMDYKDPMALPTLARAFGLGSPVDMPYFPSGYAGVIPDPTWKQETQGDGWATGDAVQMAIGQGFVLATPMQMAVAYTAIANGGEVLTPYIVDKLQAPDEDPVQVGEKKVKGTLPLTTEQMGWIQAALRSQTSDPNGYGSTKVFSDFPWSISGKTGTAQTDNDQYGRPHSWFAAYAPNPAEAPPEISSVVMVENVGEGVSYAAPITKKIYQAYLDIYHSSSVPVHVRMYG